MASQMFIKRNGSYSAPFIETIKVDGVYQTMLAPNVFVKSNGEYTGINVTPTPPTAFSNGFSSGFK